MNEAHKTFCELYLQTFNGAKAYQQVYKDASYDTARANASALLKENLEIQEYMKQRLSELTITSNEILFGIAAIARNTEEKTSDRLKAYEMLAKINAMFLDRTDITTNGEKISWQQIINSEDVKKDYKGGIVITDESHKGY